MITSQRIWSVLVLVTLAITSTTLVSYAQQAEETATTEAQAAETTAAELSDETPDPADESKASFWMDQKLRLSKDILAGLANGDFQTIGEKAMFMRRLNRVEKFVRRGPAGYRQQLSRFNSANDALVEAAEKEDLNAATKAFNGLTTSCVECHKHLRAVE